MWLGTVFFRQGVFGLNHAFFTAFSGLGFGVARLSKGRVRRIAPWAGIAGAVCFHAWHNTMAVLTGMNLAALVGMVLGALGGLGVIAVVFLLALARERQWMEEELAEEVGRTLTAEEYSWLCQRRPWSVGRRLDARWRRFYQLAAELALKKRQQRLGDRDTETALRIAQLRAELVSLKERLSREQAADGG